MALHCSNIACERNGREIFSNISLQVSPGQLLELRGPNGSGKSSLLRVIAGLVPLAAGTMQWNEQPEFSLHCHYVGHLDGLKPALTVAENLSFWASLLGGGEITTALAAFSLEALRDQPVQLLSAGQKRRTALARLVCAPRPLWLLDEPDTALDHASRQQLSNVMLRHLSGGGIIMLATHNDIGLPPNQTISLGNKT